MAESNKFFFRTENLGNDPDTYISVPEDMEWAVNDGKKNPIRRAGGGASDRGMSAPGPGGGDSSGGFGDYIDTYPNTKIDTPVIRGIVKQEVSQDPEGKGTIDVTFAVEDISQSSVEWEIRITR